MARDDVASRFRSIPSVDKVLADDRVGRLIDAYSRASVLDIVRAELEAVRSQAANGSEAPPMDQLVRSIEERAASEWRPWPVGVINATGVILHTNLGRAPLSRASLEAAQSAAQGYSDLEIDLETGRRGSRQAHVSRLVCQVTGAEAALVVNNNASAVMLGLAALAAGREVIVSRGESIEIGGGFRIPDVLRQSGAILVEVGTTNRTYPRDYEAAISEKTAAILSVHSSNFTISGFTHAPDLAELVSLGARHGIPVLHDLGSGCLLDTAEFGLAQEPMPQQSLRLGAGLAFFSGDKLLGGPQAGIIAGTAGLIATVSRHPLARAVRIDKMSMAALAATLLHYIRDEVVEEVPIWRMVATPTGELRSRAERWREVLGDAASVVEGGSTLGGGSLPGEILETWLVSIDAARFDGGAARLVGSLRRGDPPVIGRIEEERVLLDPRTVLPDEDEPLLSVVRRALPGQGTNPPSPQRES